MKKEYFIFLILIVAAAVVTGSTIAFASNFDVINSSLNQTPTANLESQLADVSNDKEDLSDSDDTYEVTVISAGEQEQILRMLKALGLVNGADPEEYIKNFQAQNSLEPTGNLDSETLSLIIEQIKLEKANES